MIRPRFLCSETRLGVHVFITCSLRHNGFVLSLRNCEYETVFHDEMISIESVDNDVKISSLLSNSDRSYHFHFIIKTTIEFYTHNIDVKTSGSVNLSFALESF